MKIGILGGTFDPIHKAHLEIGHQALEYFQLDQVWFMPAGNSYFKTVLGGSRVTDAYYRAAMVKLAIQGESRFHFSDMELIREGYTYTSDTLLELKHHNPDAELYFIIGADSLHTMKNWYAPEVIFHNASIIVAGRSNQISEEVKQKDREYLVNRYDAQIEFMELDHLDVSSSQIRMEIQHGIFPHPMLPDSINQYLEQHLLYRNPLTEEEIMEVLQKKLKPSRYRHTLGVADTAEKMARCYGTVKPEQAHLAGILHDCGKNEGTAITHGPVGARIAREEFGITDEEILGAIRWHTTGKPGMSDLEKIIFIADYIEPGRDQAPRLNELRKMAYIDLDQTMVWILEDTLSYLKNIGTNIDKSTIQTYNYYCSRIPSVKK
ncbi:MAG: nicotinate-nucleotide adenylyltransferase [Clostridiales bacterium]|nr:nicotinate-nucleotide adenylyltransferase [Clostridiales bacterium]